MKTIYFISGLPRSGSTLLCNILAQNPRFYVTPTSGLSEILNYARVQWGQLEEFRAAPNNVGKLGFLRGAMDGYFEDVTQPVIFDKGRSWLSQIEMTELLLGHKAKLLVTVRDLRDVLASMERVWREAIALENVPTSIANMQTVEQRCASWSDQTGIVGVNYNRIKDALARGYKDRICFVPFEKLTSRPIETMATVYGFLEEPWFAHDFNNVVQVTSEDDTVYGFKKDSLHTIRSEVKPVAPQYPILLGKAAEAFAGQELW